MNAMEASVVVEERAERVGEESAGHEGAVGEGAAREPASGGDVLAAADVDDEREEAPDVAGGDDAPGALSEPADEHGWEARAGAAEERAAAMADRLAAVESAADDLRRMVGESERARQVDRELLVAGVVDLDAARELVEERVADGATVVEAVSRVRERRPLLFASRGRGGVRATSLPSGDGAGGGSLVDVAEAARETGDRRLLLRYLRMRRGAG